MKPMYVKKFAAVATIFSFIFVSMLQIFANPVSADGTFNGQIINVTKMKYGTSARGYASKFQIKDSNGAIYDAICMQHSYKTPAKGAQIKMIEIPADSMTGRAVGYATKNGYLNGGDPTKIAIGSMGISKILYTENIANGWEASLGRTPISEANDHSGPNTWDYSGGASKAAVDQFIANAKNFKNPKGAVIAIGLSTSGQGQMLAVVKKWPKPGFASVQKQSAGNTWITKECPINYNLEGATYLLTDSEGVEHKLTLDKNGLSNKIECESGPAKVQEITAPKGGGYELDPKVYDVNIAEGQGTTTFQAKDAPKLDPLRMVVKKNAAGEDSRQPNLAGAIFKVEYFDELTADAAKASNTNLKKTFYFETNSNGNAFFDARYITNDSKYKSDEFYKDDNGRVVSPFGIYKITEVKAPKGMTVDEKPQYFVVNRIEGGYAKMDNDSHFDNWETPEISTVATFENGKKVNPVSELIKINDKVEMKKLAPNKAYELRATAVDVATGKTLATGTTKFTSKNYKGDIPEHVSQSEIVKLEFKGEEFMTGGDVVIYEELHELDRTNTLVAEHKDKMDKKQTVTVEKPKIHTTAMDKADGDKRINKAENQTIVDKVKYNGLLPGKVYKMTGKIMINENGKAKPLQVDGKDVVVEKEFTPEKSDGEVSLEFTVNAKDLPHGTKLVVFEDCSYNGVSICTHADINDVGQTVTVFAPPKTGDTNNSIMFYGFTTIISLVGLAFVARKMRTNR